MPCHENTHNLEGRSLKNAVHMKLRQCKEHGLDVRIIKSIETWLQSIESSLTRASTSCVGTCEFKPDHIFVTKEKTSVIDFEWESCGWPGENLANFIVFFDLKFSVLPSCLSPKEACRKFLTNYASSTADSYGTEILCADIFYVLKLLEEFLTRWTISKTWSRRAYRRWKSRIAKQKLIERTKSGEFSSLEFPKP